MKKCYRCHQFKNHLSFYKNKTKSDGYADWCKSCSKKYLKLNRDKYKNKYRATQYQWVSRRKNWINSLKNSPCLDCGNTYPPVCMDFDHRDPSTKLFNISDVTRSKQSILKEVNKCDLICSNCHRIRTRKHKLNITTFRKQHGLINSLKSIPCQDCSSLYPPECMDFDHINPHEKQFTIGKNKNKLLSVLLEEIEKCEIVCSNCHRIRTHN